MGDFIRGTDRVCMCEHVCVSEYARVCVMSEHECVRQCV